MSEDLRFRFRFTFLGCGFPIASFVKMPLLFPLNCFCSVVKNKLEIFEWIYFWFLYSVLLIYVSTSLQISHCLYYCSYLIGFNVMWSYSSYFILLFQMCFSYSGSCFFPYKILIILYMSAKNIAHVYIEITLNLLIWGKFISLLFYIPFMTALCFSIYVGFPWFISSEFCNFYNINPIQILLSVYILNVSY